MKLPKLNILLLLTIILGGCAFNRQFDNAQKEKMLIGHLDSWQEFNAEGIIEMNFQQLSFRKNINLKKSDRNWKITVFDGGIFGMKPEPFLTVSIDSLISIKMPGTEAQVFDTSHFSGLTYLLDPSLLKQFSKEIVQTGKLIISPNCEIDFSPNMEIGRILEKKNNLDCQFEYDNDLKKIRIFRDRNLLAKIEIDKIDR